MARYYSNVRYLSQESQKESFKPVSTFYSARTHVRRLSSQVAIQRWPWERLKETISCSGSTWRKQLIQAFECRKCHRVYLPLGVGEYFRIGDEVIAKFADVAAVARSCRNFHNVSFTWVSRRQMPSKPFPTAVNKLIHELAIVCPHSDSRDSSFMLLLNVNVSFTLRTRFCSRINLNPSWHAIKYINKIRNHILLCSLKKQNFIFLFRQIINFHA